MSQLLLLRQQQHIHIVMFLQGSCEYSTLTAEEKNQREGDVLSGVAISNHLEQRSFLAVTSFTVVWERVKRIKKLELSRV